MARPAAAIEAGKFMIGPWSATIHPPQPLRMAPVHALNPNAARLVREE